jgi:hypothetical protein
MARAHEVNENDFGQRLPCTTEAFGRILSHGDEIALAFEAATICVARLRLIIDQESGCTADGVDSKPPFFPSRQEDRQVHGRKRQPVGSGWYAAPLGSG